MLNKNDAYIMPFFCFIRKLLVSRVETEFILDTWDAFGIFPLDTWAYTTSLATNASFQQVVSHVSHAISRGHRSAFADILSSFTEPC